MNRRLCIIVLSCIVTGCAAAPAEPPTAVPEQAVAAQRVPDPPKPVEVVAMPQPLPLPGQLKPMVAMAPVPIAPEGSAAISTEPPASTGKAAKGDSPVVTKTADAHSDVVRATNEARVAPTRESYLNAIEVWPYSEGALYEVYTSPGRVTDMMLQPGETLVSVSAGDTVRWIVGDTTSASGSDKRVHVLLKPIRTNLKTNLVITTNRRTYLLELTSTQDTWMASVSWDYPQDRLLALKAVADRAEAAAPVADGIRLERLAFRYSISGDTPPWRPLRAFDDGAHVYIQFPGTIAQDELPPLFVVGAKGTAELVNYRYRAPYYVVDRLFGAAELRLGGDKAQVVRIDRTDAGRTASGS
jgi:type IV secretion system protein VirB9